MMTENQRYRRKYRRDHIDKIKKYAKDYYKENREYVINNNAKWYKENRERNLNRTTKNVHKRLKSWSSIIPNISFCGICKKKIYFHINLDSNTSLLINIINSHYRYFIRSQS